MQIKEITDSSAWGELVVACAANPLQSWQWGELKAKTGAWTAYRLACVEDGELVGGAQVLVRKLPFPFRALAYAPRGPFARDNASFVAICEAVAQWCAWKTPSVCLRIEPELTKVELPEPWREGDRVLLAKTATVDIVPSEDEIMKSIPNRKCRQYIRKAERDGVVVRHATADDLDDILDLYHATAEADGFSLHVDEYYRTAFDELEGVQQVFVAEGPDGGGAQAFLWNVLTPGGTTFELWGAVNDAGKRSRANYYMKWCAMREAKAAGSTLYDLNGLLNDGISDFKMLFTKEPTYWAGTFDRPLNHLYGAMLTALDLRGKALDMLERAKTKN